MNAPMILLCILITFFLIGQLRVGCKVVYDQNGVQVFVRIAALHICVSPINKKSGSPKTKKAKKAKKAKKDKKNKRQKEAVPLPEKIGGALGYAETLLPVLLKAVKFFFRKLQIDTLHLNLTSGSSNPADAAMLYATASAALGALWYPLVQAFDVKDGYAKVDLDFDSEEMKLNAIAALSIKLGQMLWLAIYFGIWTLVRFLRERKRQKNEKKMRKAV